MESTDIVMEEKIEKKNTIQFLGKGSQLFAIDLVNALLILLTLGIYYPWAKARKLKYVYQHTSMAESRFDFLGTGKEIFRGFIKAILILGTFYAIVLCFYIYAAQIKENEVLLAVFIVVLVLLVLVGLPFFGAYAVFGTFRYRSARSSWRGILCGFEADKKKFISIFLKGYYFIVLTYGGFIGIVFGSTAIAQSYGQDSMSGMASVIIMIFMFPLMILFVYALSWFRTNLYSMTYGNLRLGDLRLNYKGKVGDLFGIQVGGVFLVPLTLGIYYFWYKKNLYNFLIENLWIEQDDVEYKTKSTITGGQVFRLEVGNLLLLIFTLGLGYSWAYCRTARFIARNIILPEEIDVNRIKQTEKAYTDATGEEMGAMMDMGGIFF